MSQLSDRVHDFIKKLLPNYTCIVEYEVKGGVNGLTSLRFDFCIPGLKLMIEVQGEQHFKFSKHFHKTRDHFRKAQARDGLKQEWCSKNGYDLVYFNYDEIDSLTDEGFMSRILSSQ